MLAGAMTLALIASAAWRYYATPGPDMDAPASSGLYQHKTPEPPGRRGDDESFHYVRAGEPVQVASDKVQVEDLSAELRGRLGVDLKRAAGKKKIPLPPAVEAVLDMMPAQHGTPHVEGRPQLIPQTTAPGGAPVEEQK